MYTYHSDGVRDVAMSIAGVNCKLMHADVIKHVILKQHEQQLSVRLNKETYAAGTFS